MLANPREGRGITVSSSSVREEPSAVVPPERLVEEFSQEVEDSAEAALHALEVDLAPPSTEVRAKNTVKRSWTPRPKAAASPVGLARQPQLASS